MRGPNKKLTPFGKLVVKALADQDMTKAELAAEVGVAPQYLSYILNGTRSGGKYLPAIVAALELDPEEGRKGDRGITPTEGRDRGAGRIHHTGGSCRLRGRQL